MTPAQLTDASFSEYPPQARALAEANLATLRELPLVFAPILLREISGADWKLPAERREMNGQLRFLASLTAIEREQCLRGFAGIALDPSVAQGDWVRDPGGFIEKLTAWLWSSHQMDRFRKVADEYQAAVTAASPAEPKAGSTLGVVVLGQGVETTSYPLFQKLRPQGVLLTRVQPEGGLAVLLAEVRRRAAAGYAGAPWSVTAAPDFAHWHIDGDTAPASPNLALVSYGDLAEPRRRLLDRMQRAISSGDMGPESLRSLLARLEPGEIGLPDGPAHGVLSRFQLSLLTEGSGTQIFATTFVQWAARECVRRAQPQTVLLHYTPRQQAQTMDAMLSGAPVAGVDPMGSLIDADEGAYYTWLNLRRISGVAEQMRFLVWFEGHGEAMAIGPGLPGGTTSSTAMDMHGVLKLLA